MTRRIAILGSGITGLAAAYALRKAVPSPDRLAITLIEAGDHLGGSLSTEHTNGFLIERGADSFLTTKPLGIALARAVGLAGQLQGMAQRGVYGMRHGRLEPFPEGFMMMASPRLGPLARTHLLSPPGKVRAAMDLVLPARKDTRDESLASFVRRRLGREVLDRMAEPMVANIHAGDAERLSVQSLLPQFAAYERAHGSVIRGLRKPIQGPRPADPSVPRPFATFRSGMGALAEALGQGTPAVDHRLRTTAVRIEAARDGTFRVIDQEGGTLAADAILLATPAFVSSDLLRGIAPELASALGAISYASSVAISLAFAEDACRRLDGTGFLVPRSEGLRLKACTWSSAKFDGRAPSGHVLLRAFYGGAGEASILSRPDADLVALALEELRPLMQLRGPPELARIHRWPRAHPQYDVGHKARVAAIEAANAQVPGVFLAGSAYRGVGVPDCIEDAQRAAEQTLDFLEPRAAVAEALA